MQATFHLGRPFFNAAIVRLGKTGRTTCDRITSSLRIF